MSSEWIKATWGDVVTLKYGKSIRNYKNAVGAFPVYGTNGPIGWHHTPLCATAGVIVGRKGAYRGIHFSHKPFFVIDTAFYLSPKNELDAKWAYYCLLTYDINGMDSGSAIPSTSRDDFYKLPVLLPPIEEQKEISDFLGKFDDRIALLRDTNATLEAIAQALFKSWFVDFDPVHAKQEGRAPEGMDDATAALFPDSFEESELGLVPMGWRATKLGLVCNYLSRGISPKYLESGGVLVINQKCIRDFSVDYSKARRHDSAQRKIDGRLIVVGDVLVNSTGVGTLGRVAQVLQLPEVAIVDSHVTVVRANEQISWPYLGQVIMRKQSEIEAMGEGSTGQTELSRSKLADIMVLVPPASMLMIFDQLVIPLKERIAVNELGAKTLTTLRDTLLPRLISGQLRLPEAETQLNEIAHAL